MPAVFCCAPCRHPSPVLPNSRHVDTSTGRSNTLLTKSHIPASIRSLDTSKSGEEVEEIRQIFASSCQEPSGQEIIESPWSNDFYAEAQSGRMRQQRSSSRLQDLLRKKLSRDSVTSGRTSKRNSKSTLSEEDIARRKELKRALHKRLQEEILADRRASEGGYDADAETVVVPQMTKSRSTGAMQISLQNPSNSLKRLQSYPSLEKTPVWRSTDSLRRPISRLKMSSLVLKDGQTPSLYKKLEWADDTTKQIMLASRSALIINNAEESSKLGHIIVAESHKRVNNTPPRVLLEQSDIPIKTTDASDTPMESVPPIDNLNFSDALPSPDLSPLPVQNPTEILQHISRPSFIESLEDNSDSGQFDLSINDVAQPSRDLAILAKWWHPRSLGLVGRTSHETNVSKPLAYDTSSPNVDDRSEEPSFGGVDGGEESRQSTGAHFDSVLCQSTGIVSLTQLPMALTHQRGKSSGGGSAIPVAIKRHGRQSSSSGFASAKVPLAWGTVLQDSASSIYPSQAGSLMPSPSSSVLRARPNFSGRLVNLGSEAPPNPYSKASSNCVANLVNMSEISSFTDEVHASRRRTVDTTSFLSSTDSFRAQEIAAAESRIVPKPRASSAPKKSRFIEELGKDLGTTRRFSENLLLGSKHPQRSSLSGFDGSGEWYNANSRPGYGYEFVHGQEDSAAELWERALQDHSEQRKSFSGGRNGSELEKRSHTSLKKGTRAIQGSRIIPPLRKISAVDPKESRFEDDTQQIPINDAGPGTPSKTVGKLRGSPTSSTASWRRFPSHNRAERSPESAGEADNVIARDFAPKTDGVTGAADGPKKGLSFFGKKKKSRSMTFGRNIFKSWSRLYNSRSAEFKGYRRSYRSSVSVGGVLDYPELEILPVSSLSETGPKEDPQFITFAGQSGAASVKSRESVVHTVFRTNMADRSAKVWSQLYEDCVEYPYDIEEAKTPGIPSPFLHPSSALQNRNNRALRSEPGSQNDIMGRDSSSEFQRSLQAQEAQARENFLQAAQKAWGT
ncbi:hypothetical protein MMC06_004326 [Schaereria dolodes]|nr:hypothetical protein [Schaereria dolodes]